MHDTAQTDAKDAGSPSADDFLARERAFLGEEASQFTTSNDDAAFLDASDDLLAGGGDSSDAAQFKSQFPDINSGNEVRPSIPFWQSHILCQPFKSNLFHSKSHPVVPSPAAPQSATTQATPHMPKRRRTPRSSNNGGISAMLAMPSEPSNSRPRRPRPSKKPNRTSMTSTRTTTPRRRRPSHRLVKRRSSFWQTGRIQFPVALAGSASPSWLTSVERDQRAVLVDPARSVSVRC